MRSMGGYRERTSGLFLPAVAGNYVTTPDANEFDITGDIDIRACVALAKWVPGATVSAVRKFGNPGQRSYVMGVGATGTIRGNWSIVGDGSGFITVDSDVLGFSDGSKNWIRMTLDVDNGAGGYTVTFYKSDNGVVWTQVGAPLVGGAPTSIFVGTEPLIIGSVTSSPVAWNVYRVQVLNGINGTSVYDADFTAGVPAGMVARTGHALNVVRI